MNTFSKTNLAVIANGRFQRRRCFSWFRGCRKLHPRLLKSIAFSDMVHFLPPLPRPSSPLSGLSLHLQSRLWRIAVVFLFVAVAIEAHPQNNSPFSSHSTQLIEEGDLIFVAQPQDNAITQVTQGIDSLAIDHVAIMHRIGGEKGPLYALEAIPRLGVVLTPIDSLVTREQGATFVLQRVEDVDATSSVRKALRYVGLPYDDLFLPGDSAIYCSELVQISYVDRQGRVLFDTIPMSFHDGTGRITDYWTDFYRQRGMTVPEGLPGTNPGQLSRLPQMLKLTQFQKKQATDD